MSKIDKAAKSLRNTETRKRNNLTTLAECDTMYLSSLEKGHRDAKGR
jgi:hypothetical protein